MTVQDVMHAAAEVDDAPLASPDHAADRSTSRLGVQVPPVLTFVAFIVAWYVYSRFNFDNATQRSNALPYPHEVINKGFLPITDKVNGLRPILGYMWPTVKVTLLGLVIAIVMGTLFAVVMNLSKGLERAFFPYAVVLQTIPILARRSLRSTFESIKIGRAHV